MAKVIGAIFTIVGFLFCLFIIFLYLNSSAFLEYNAGTITFLETGYMIPAYLGSFLLITGLVLLFASKEDAFVEY